MRYEVDEETCIVTETAVSLPRERVLDDGELLTIFKNRQQVQIYLDTLYRYKLSHLVIVHDVNVHIATTKPLSLINYGDLHESQVHLPN